MDYSRLRAAALRDGEAEEAVTVDTRALIDKVLARYSGEWTTLRELIQNAADAQATTVKIRWETLPSTTVPLPAGTDVAGGGEGAAERASSDLLRHTILHHTLRRLLVENDGQPFAATDWARLKRIAEGNPDETKIGAFGVGFYSVFADCEEPFVSSGAEAMAFYWKGNALFTRKLVVPADQRSPTDATTFVLDYRNATTALPNLLSVSQFLASSLTFVALQRIEFWIDDWQILDLRKTLSPSTAVAIPRDLSTRTKDGLMTVAAVEASSAQIDAVFMKAVGWKPPAGGGGASVSGGGGGTSGASKTTDSYGLSAADLPSLRSFFSRLTSSATASASALASQRSKAAREERAAQEALQHNLTGLDKASITLRVTSATVKTKVAANFAAELERATKKPPPKTTSMSILTSSYGDASASLSQPESIAADVFASVLPSKKPGGRIFIGFPTMQTTGGGLHVSAPSLIPTVEREAIDLNARWVRNWNMELLRAAGILTRLAYGNAMAVLDSKFRQHLAAARPESSNSKSKKLPTPTAAELAAFVPEATHILQTYTFGDSTPSAYVGQIIEEAFWTAYTVPAIDMFSTRGVLSTTQVRMGDDKINQFVDGIPVVVPAMKDNAFVRKLHDFGILHDMTLDDVRSELEAKPLNRVQLTHFVQWLAGCAATGELDPPSVRQLLRAGVATLDAMDATDTTDGDDETDGALGRPAIIELDTIRSFLAGNKIPAGLPLPPTTLPYAFTSAIPQTQLVALGWTPLELVPWLQYLLEARKQLGAKRDVTQSPVFAAQVLVVLSKNWENMAVAHRATVQRLLTGQTTMPTKLGMRRPADAFFPSVRLFDDLPTLAPSCHGLKDKFLVALGVRKTIDLDTIFTRLLTGGKAEGEDCKDGTAKWSHVELAKYLASVRADIPAADFARLGESAICPAEAGPAGQEWTVPSTRLYRAKELFEPTSAVRALGFPIMQWPGAAGSFRRTSPEGGLLASLGLRLYPSVPELVAKMASTDRALRDKARAYFVANHLTNGYTVFSVAQANLPILPVERSGGDKDKDKDAEELVAPSACFINPEAAVLGFAILRADLRPHASQFGVATNPPILACVKRLLQKPPRGRDEAVVVFEYFASRLSDMGNEALRQLQQGAFVPVVRRGGTGGRTTTVEHVRPDACYLGTSTLYGDIFDFVDFGRRANTFLFQVGSKAEPTKVELARQACKEPARLLSTLQTSERYLALLRSLAEDLPRLKEDRALFAQMKTAPFLLASREAAATGKETTATADTDEAPVRQYQLVAANRIAVVDDYISYRLFKDKLMCAPEEDALESFYLALGAQFLSSTVQEEMLIGRHSADQTQAATLQKYVLERSKIFLYEYQKYRQDAVRHDHRWLARHLQVELVQSVALRRSLRGSAETHTETRSAASARARGGSGGHVLYIAAGGGALDMYQVGQAVCQVVLNRPSQQAYFFFEPFLKLGLLELRARGYNVDRILREKQAEARLAEEERRKALAAEREVAERQRAEEAEEEEQLREEERLQRKGRAETAAAAAGGAAGGAAVGAAGAEATTAANSPQTPTPRMPGAFDASPEPQPYTQPQPETGRRNRGLFSSLTRRLGLEPEDDEDKGRGSGGGGSGGSGGSEVAGGSGNSGSLTSGTLGTTTTSSGEASPEAVQRDMHNAIQAARRFGSSTLFHPPSASAVQEQATYCDSNHAHDLGRVATAPGGMAVYVSRELDGQRVVAAKQAAIAAFEGLLGDVAAVYGLATGVLQIYDDTAGPTIAFNSGGSIFCNLRYFMNLHAPAMLGAATTVTPTAATRAQARVDATVWWWVVLAHELAHNLEPIHNARHSFYTESFVQEYFHKMTTRAATWSTRQEAPPSYHQAMQGQR